MHDLPHALLGSSAEAGGGTVAGVERYEVGLFELES
jgi:hypothetical protein